MNDYLQISLDGEILQKCDINAIGSIIVPNGIIGIEQFAFKDCKSISEIILPKSLSFIKWGAVSGCSSLETISIPESIKELPYDCFKDCINLSVVQLPEGLKKIESDSFNGCVSITQINIPATVTEIGHSAFKNCSSLETISIPENISSIGYETFQNCESLYEVYLPKNLTSIESEAFSGCESLLSITIPKKVNIVRDKAFSNCSNLNCVIIESNDISIEPTAFLNCFSINRLYLANFYPNIVISAFGDCTNLNIISPLSDLSKVKSKDSTNYQIVHKNFAAILKYMSIYYRLFGMNLTQMKWCESLRNLKSFKEPININWENYKTMEQPLADILNIDWLYSGGIGLVLGFNNYRALDFDINSFSDFTFKVIYDNGTVDDFILDTLKKLGLPDDYPWVVRSGNGYGFHIIFQCEDIEATKNIDSISYEPANKYNEYFIRLELRWADHLVLPPSMHASGNQYRFRNNGLPSCPPSHLCLSQIDKLLIEYCGNRQILSAKYGEIDIYYTKIEKIHSRHDSYLSPHEYNEDSVAYLQNVETPEGLNILALKHIFAKDTKFDKNLALSYFEQSNTQSSLFNLLNLYACGFYPCSRNKFDELLSKLDDKLFEDYIDALLKNADIHIPKSKTFLFFDTETTGLPKDYDAPTHNTDNWPRIIQLSWIITDDNQIIRSKHNYIVKPNGFSIPKESTSIHGITTDYAIEHGLNIDEVINNFVNDLSNVDYIVGHNLLFDKHVVEAEIYRIKKDYAHTWPKELCTMRSTVKFCKLPGLYHKGYRFPKLQELYYKLFGTDFFGAHDAFNDIKATVKCFWELKNKYKWENDDFSPYEQKDDDLPF